MLFPYVNLCLFVVQCLSTLRTIEGEFTVKAWQSTGESFEFPEQTDASVADIMSRSNVAITFSGGGSRAYTAALGQMSALLNLALIDSVRYMAGSSGGSWATVVASYYQNNSVSDEILYGPILQPQQIFLENISDMDPSCARSFTDNYKEDDSLLYTGWLSAVQEIYFDPSGIFRWAPFTYNDETQSDIVQRNPTLADTTFMKVRGTDVSIEGIKQRPYPIIQSTLVGPTALLPWNSENRNYSLMEWTPLSAGVVYTRDVTFNPEKGTTQHSTVGGLVEPFVFNASDAPVIGLPAGQSSGILQVPEGIPSCDLALASGSSSYAYGADAAALKIGETIVGSINYWAPSAESPENQEEEYAVADGGAVSNTDLISLLQRGVTTIFAFVNTGSPLQNSTNWNPSTDPLTEDSIDFTVPAWFGIITPNLSDISTDSFDLNNSQVFVKEDWLPFVTALQAAQASGNGNVITFNHRTAANAKWGLKGGYNVTVVWYYNGRALGWEALLNDEMRALVQPATDPADQANVVDSGTFKDFPAYPTLLSTVSLNRSNLLADFTGWNVLNNAQQYIDAMNNAEPGVSTSSDDDDENFISSVGGVLLFSCLIAMAIVAVIAWKYKASSRQANPPLSELVL